MTGLLQPIRAVGENVALPIAAYLLLTSLGAAPVWALTGSAAVAVVILAAGWVRTRSINALGIMVLVRFLLSLLLAGFTSDARLLLVKDAMITAGIALVMGGSLVVGRPLIERIRRELSADRAAFDSLMSDEPGYRFVHRRLTAVWTCGLLVEASVSATIALTAPLTAAVVITTITGPLVIATLVLWTEYSARAVARRPGRIRDGTLRS